MSLFHDDDQQRIFDRTLARRLFGLLRPRGRTVVAAMVIALLAAALQLSVPLWTKYAIDEALLAPGDPEAAGAILRWMVLGLMLAGVGNLLAGAAQSWLIQHAGQHVLFDLRRTVLTRLLHLPARETVRQPVGKLLTRAVNDPNAINDFIGAVVVELFRDLALITGCCAILLWLDWRLFLVAAGSLPLLLLTAWLFKAISSRCWRSLHAAKSVLNTRMAETLGGLEELQLARAEERSRASYAQANRTEYHDGMRLIHAFAIFQPAFHLIAGSAIAMTIWSGAWSVSAGTAVGSVVAAIGIVELLFGPVRQLAEKYNVFQSALASVERVGAVLDAKPEVDTGTIPVPAGPATLRFENVWFAYPGRGDDDETDEPVWVLKDMSFELTPGKRVALVGSSGAGKSTVVALLLRSYQPQRGQITLDGIPIDQFPLTEWRRRIGLVLQEAALMAGSVEGNVRAVAPDAESSVLEAAASATGLDQLPDGGIKRELGEGGAGLSAGQRQLVALARALAGDPALLVLDEATAHVDSHAEARVQAAIDARDERGMLIIAHRLATVRTADEILVMRGGAVIERGKRAELLDANGPYADLEAAHRGTID